MAAAVGASLRAVTASVGRGEVGEVPTSGAVTCLRCCGTSGPSVDISGACVLPSGVAATPEPGVHWTCSRPGLLPTEPAPPRMADRGSGVAPNGVAPDA